MPDSDFIRRRLTHSLEVACVGRSLGTALGQNLLISDGALASSMPQLDWIVGQITSNACLAHDIGNPPFGHAGEKAIGSWFSEHLPASLKARLSPAEVSDFEKFEGNAQGFRLLTRLQDNKNAGGMRLTYATLATFTKYPTTSSNVRASSYIGAKKHGFFQADVDAFDVVAADVGLPTQTSGWSRHPLVFLVEAADDICYSVTDIEDAYRLGRFSLTEAEGHLVALIGDPATYKPEADEVANIGWLRGKAINNLVLECEQAFVGNMSDILSGTHSKSLTSDIPSAAALKTASQEVQRRVFDWDRTISAEIAGGRMIQDVLERVVLAIAAPNVHANALVLKIIPGFDERATTYEQLLSATDFVSGMTDSYLHRMHRRLTGQAIY
jgi:dGTPase